MHWKVSLTTVLTLAMAIAWSQETTPPAPAPEEEEEELIPVKLSFGDIGFRNIEFSGSKLRFNQYAAPKSGVIVPDFRLLAVHYPGVPYAMLGARGTIGGDYVYFGKLAINSGRTLLEYDVDDYDFRENTPIPVGDSGESNRTATLTHKTSNTTSFFARYRKQEHDDKYEPPRDHAKYTQRTVSGGFEGLLAGGNFGVYGMSQHFEDRFGYQLNRSHSAISTVYGLDLSPGFNVEGTFAYSLLEQHGNPDAKIKRWGLNAAYEAGPDTDILFSLLREDYKIEQTVNDYIRERFTTNARVVQRWPNWTMQLGYRRKETERVRGDQNFVDVPRWSTYDVRLRGKLTDSVRFHAKGVWDELSNGANMTQLADPRRAYWDDRFVGTLGLDAGSDLWAAYLNYTRRFLENESRGVEVNSEHWTLGGSYAFTDKISAYGEVADERYSATGVDDELGYSLDWFFPDSRSWTLGMNYVVNEKSHFSVAYTQYVTDNDNPLSLPNGNLKARQLTLQYGQQVSPDQSFNIMLAPWTYRDRVSDTMDYNVTVMTVTYKVKF